MTSLDEELLQQLNNLGGGWPEAPENQFSRVVPCVADSVRELFVDVVNGSDENGGESRDDALATKQEAVLRFKSPWRTPVWAEGEDRVITEIYTPGMPITEESIVIPPHAGEGFLRIEAEEQTLQADLAQNGALAAVASSGNVLSTLNFTGATLTANEFDKLGFCKVQARVYSLPAQLIENLPIVTTAASSLVVVAADPGSYTAYEWTAGVAFDIVAPQIKWRNQDSTNAVDSAHITNMGGGLIVSGYEFLYSGASGSNHYVLNNRGNNAYPQFVSSAQIVRCMTDTGFAGGWMSGGDVGVNIIGEAYRVASDCDGVIGNCLLTSVLAGPYFHKTSGLIFGLFIDATAATHDFLFNNCQDIHDAYVSIDGASIKVKNSYISFNGFKAENVGAEPALLVEKRSYVEFTVAADVEGATGNTNFGCLVDAMSMVNVPNGSAASIALSGSSGNLQVGSGAGASTWAGGAVQSAVGRNATYSG